MSNEPTKQFNNTGTRDRTHMQVKASRLDLLRDLLKDYSLSDGFKETGRLRGSRMSNYDGWMNGTNGWVGRIDGWVGGGMESNNEGVC